MLQLNDREPRENRGRLRHCNGIQTPRATEPEIGIGKAGARSNPKSGYRFSCARRGCLFLAANFSVKEKDETSSLKLFFSELVEYLHSPLWRGLKVFLCPQLPHWSLSYKRRPYAAERKRKISYGKWF